jgi:hypothetical protein
MKSFSAKSYESEPMGLDEFMGIAGKLVDPSRPETLELMQEPLWRLARNRTLFTSRIQHDLASWRNPERLSFYTSQSCVLAKSGDLLVRFNIWPTLPDDPRRRKVLSNLLSYYDFHDHNFSFLTANVFGPGYRTRVYEYDGRGVIGYPGEQLALQDLGMHTLDFETVLLFVGGRDIHQQLPPDSLSMSVNLMLTSAESSLINQYYFDPAAARISGYVESLSTRRVNGISFASQLGDDETVQLLSEIAASHPCDRSRAEALFELEKLRPEDDAVAQVRVELQEASPLLRVLLGSGST